MSRTEDEFVTRWRRHLAGLALYGTVSELRDGPLVRASKVLDIPAEVERLLKQMYADLKPAAEPKPVAAPQPEPTRNGQHAAPQQPPARKTA